MFTRTITTITPFWCTPAPASTVTDAPVAEPAAAEVPAAEDAAQTAAVAYGSLRGIEERQAQAMRFQYSVVKAGDPAHRTLADALWLQAEKALAGASTLEVQDALFALLFADLRARIPSDIRAVEIGTGGHAGIIRSLLKHAAAVAAIDDHDFGRLKKAAFAPGEARKLTCLRDTRFILSCVLQGPRYQIAVVNMPENRRQLALARMAIAEGGFLVLQTELPLDFIVPLDNDADWVKVLHYPQNGNHGRMTLDSGSTPFAHRAAFCVYRRITRQRGDLRTFGNGLKRAHEKAWRYGENAILRIDPVYAVSIDFSAGAIDIARVREDRGHLELSRIGSIDAATGQVHLNAGESRDEVMNALQSWFHQQVRQTEQEARES